MQSTKFDKKVLIVEASESNIGGTWISKGTVPSKALRAAAKLIQSFESQFGDEKGRKPYERFRMEDIMAYKKPILEGKNKKVKDDIIKNEVDTARGWGRLIDGHTVEVVDHLNEKKIYTASYILVSTGSSPTIPKNIDIDHTKILDYTSILDLTHIPRRLVIIGSGTIAIEFATVFAALGTRVAILNEEEDVVPFLDHEIKSALLKTFKKKNIQLENKISIEKVASNDLRNCDEVHYKIGESERLQVVETDHVLYIGGKAPNTKNLGLKEVGVELDEHGYVSVNNMYQSSIETVFAAGDVIGQPSLASASFLQGRLASVKMFGNPEEITNSDTDLPFGIYSIPEIAGIGLTEDQAIELGMDITVGRAYYENLTKADLNHETDGILKLIFKTDNLQLVGVQIYGEYAADLVHLGQSVMANNGSIKFFIQRVLNYPTYTEAYKIAAFNGLNRVSKSGVKYKKLLDRD